MTSVSHSHPVSPQAASRPGTHAKLLRVAYDVLENRRLTPLFQPIIDMKSGAIAGYEGLVRGPSDSPLHSPVKLLKLARQSGLAYEVEKLCCQVVVARFVELQLPGSLFVNFSPEVLMQEKFRESGIVEAVRLHDLAPENVVIELTESEPVYEYNLEVLLEVAMHYQSLGFKIAIDDLGDGLSSPRLWSELRPEYVKIDRHFIQNIDKDPVKAQFVESLREAVAGTGCQVIAEGIETHAELMLVHRLGVPFGQGYHIARPSETPSPVISAEVAQPLRAPGGNTKEASSSGRRSVVEEKLLIRTPGVCPETPNEVVFQMFESDPQLHAVAVVKDGAPLGMVNRYQIIDSFARPFRHELYGKKPCRKFMDREPLIVDKNISIQELGYLIAAADRRHLSNGFIFTENGRYIGIGTGHDLMREITEMQILAARYANPLTQLPGNVPISERTNTLLDEHVPFCACYCDLDHFKPFNDVYGFSQGDAMIQATGKVLAEVCDPELDFLGHIGGDDFIILFRSADWEARCRRALDRFGEAVTPFFSLEDRENGGYVTENRRGEKEFHALTTLSIGATRVEPGTFQSYMEISAVAAETKKMAKKIPGNSLYVDNRHHSAIPVQAPAQPSPQHSPMTEWQMPATKRAMHNSVKAPLHPPPAAVQ